MSIALFGIDWLNRIYIYCSGNHFGKNSFQGALLSELFCTGLTKEDFIFLICSFFSC